MRDVYIARGMSPYTRDDPRYYSKSEDHPQPADHTEAGFFMLGPDEPPDPIEKKISTRECPWTPETPLAARGRTTAERAFRRRVLTRQLAFVQAARATVGPFVRRGPTRWKVA